MESKTPPGIVNSFEIPPNEPAQPSEAGPSDSNNTGATNIDLFKSCKIVDVSFEGAHKTKPRLLAKIVSDVFAATSLMDCLEKSVQVRENLKSLNAFSNIQLQVEPASEEIADEYRVTFKVEERGRLKASAQTSIDNHSKTHINLELALPNLNGIGDSITLSSKFNKRLYSGECSYTLPIRPWKSLFNPIYSLSYRQYQFDGQPSGFDQEDRSVVNQVDFFSTSNVHHSISFENIWRFIRTSSLNTPIEIREQAGHSVKSALKHTVTWDDRVGGNFPYSGILARLSNEFTTNLVSGSAKFTRHEASLQMNALILPQYDLLCQINLLAGTLIRPLKYNICDKFFAGGPLTLRGFKYQGLEPNVRGCPLGDLSYLSAGIHLYSILPYTTPETPINDYIRPHIFMNTGTIGDLNEIWRLTSFDDVRREARRFRNSLRYSCGFGLVMYFMSLRLEVNYCLPLIFRENDLSTRGLQWGFGLTYT